MALELALSIMPAASPSYSIPCRGARLEETWPYLGIVSRLAKQESLSSTTYTDLYTTVYNYCTSTTIQTKPNGHKGKRFLWLTPLGAHSTWNTLTTTCPSDEPFTAFQRPPTRLVTTWVLFSPLPCLLPTQPHQESLMTKSRPQTRMKFNW